jgi:GrpB-like predicted nucleotidyltransferase (UPF0157 family)
MRKVEVVPHNPDWQQTFEQAAQQVAQALGDNVVAIHHIGSTAIPGIYAKPIIDLLLVVRAIVLVDQHNPAMAAQGYEESHRDDPKAPGCARALPVRW